MKTKKNTQTSARLRFATNMRKARNEIGISQEAFADQCGLHRTYIGSVERGERNISVDNMETIAIALGQKLMDLLAE
jgi:transcriptional regulator with XRE-family HTH domain